MIRHIVMFSLKPENKEENTAEFLRRGTELCGLPVRPDTDEENGLIICRFPENMDEKAVVLLDSLVLGCVTIEKQYGKRYCKVKFEEV